MNQQRAGYTKGGFSKGFSCCSRWKECSMGKLNCALEYTDPEAKEYCSCYKRNHEYRKQKPNKSDELKKNVSIAFKDSADELLVTYIGKNPYSSLEMGKDYVLKPTRELSQKTAYVYQMDGTLKGRKYLSEFAIKKENRLYSRSEVTQQTSVEPIKNDVVNAEEINGHEQLSLF